MKPILIPIEEKGSILRAGEAIQAGELIAFPTDTVYGLGASPYHPGAVEALYAAKGRTMAKAIPVLIGGLSDLPRVASAFPEPLRRLADEFWPGPLTLILPRHPDLPRDLSGLATVGVRVPDHGAARRLLQHTGPLAVTSANQSGGVEPRRAGDVQQELGDAVSVVLDGGMTPGGTPSTVIAFEQGSLTVLREGPLSRDVLEKVLHEGNY